MRILPAVALAGASVCGMYAGVTLPYVLTDHMVVQRGRPVHIWGKADPGERVTVAFRGEERAGTADELGRWSVYLAPGEAGGPFEITVRAANTITLRDILVGDVWIASGQSNMEWPVDWAANPEKERAAANYPRIRLVRAMHKVSDFPVDNFVGQMWKPCTPETVRNFSAVGYHFGRLLQERYEIPIGLIQTAWGGTPADAWTSMRAISSDPGLMPVFAEWDGLMQEHALNLLRYSRAAKQWEAASARAKAAGQPQPPDRPEPPRLGPGGPFTPAGLWNAMVSPLTNLAIRGVIWYQGEANGSNTRALYYGRLFQAMIRDWRRAWGQGDFPFLFVQLANYNAPDSNWPEVREGQRQALGLVHTAMAVTIDVGTPDNIHPPDKRTVAARLALAARAVAYGERIEYSGPLVRQVTRQDGALRVWFDHAEGLTARGGRVRGFEVAGANREYHAAEARIEGATVVARSVKVPAPRYVRYGWKDNPDCNLYNAAGLPASPFRME